MDKIKPYLELLKKHHFWLLAVLILFISAYAWWSGTAAYNTAFTSNSGQITSTFSKVRLVSGTANPPNGTYKDALGEFRKQQATSTLNAWQTLYDRQKALLTWPDWAKDIATAKPASPAGEAEGAASPVQEFTDTRSNYLNSFPKYFAELFQIVKPLETVAPASTTTPAPQNRPGGIRPAVGQRAPQPVAQTTGIVEWPVGDRDALVAKYHWKTTPTLTQVRVAQENYWLFRALFEIIAKTNESAGATDRYNAAIKKIETIAIAQEALAAPKATLEKLSPEILAAAAGDASAASVKPPTTESPDPELLANRYVDPQGNPVASEAADAEFKLIPLWLRFRIDQRAIPNLLVACANSAIPVEVRQVLYNPSAGSGGGGGRTGPAVAVEAAASDSFFDCTLDVRGVIYLFNPPNQESLGLIEPGAEGTEPGGDQNAPPDAEPVTNPEPPAATGEATPPAADATPPAADVTTPGAEKSPPASTEPPATDAAPTEPAAPDAAPAVESTATPTDAPAQPE